MHCTGFQTELLFQCELSPVVSFPVFYKVTFILNLHLTVLEIQQGLPSKLNYPKEENIRIYSFFFLPWLALLSVNLSCWILFFVFFLNWTLNVILRKQT